MDIFFNIMYFSLNCFLSSTWRWRAACKFLFLILFSSSSGERDSFFSFLGYIYSYLAPPSSLIPYFPCYFYSASKVIGNQREMNDSMKEKEKKLVWTSIILSSTFAFWSEEYFVKNSRFMLKIYFKSLFSLQKNLNLPIDYEFEKCLIFFAFSNWFKVFWEIGYRNQSIFS